MGAHMSKATAEFKMYKKHTYEALHLNGSKLILHSNYSSQYRTVAVLAATWDSHIPSRNGIHTVYVRNSRRNRHVHNSIQK